MTKDKHKCRADSINVLKLLIAQLVFLSFSVADRD